MNEQKKYTQTRQQFEKEYALSLAVKLPFPESLQQAMKAAWLSVETLADKTGVSPDTISAYKEGKRFPQKPMAVAIALMLGLDYEQFVLFLNGLGMALSLGRKEEYAYKELLLKHRGKSIEELNNYLKEIEIEEKYWLKGRGTYDRNKASDKQKKEFPH